LGEIFTERKGGGSGRRIGSSVPTIFWREEKRKKKRGRRSPDQTGIDGRAPASLTLYHV
jgi:hypothetical protein